MINRFLFFLALILGFGIYSCATVPHEEIHMSRLSDVNSGNYSLRTDYFGQGETPSVVVTGCGGHNVTVRIYNLNSGNLVKTYKDYVPENWTKWWWFKDLPGGSYQAVLFIGGETKGTTNFTISK